MIIVYHNTNQDNMFRVDNGILFRFDSSTQIEQELINIQRKYVNDFEYVADVDTNDMNEAYQLTNSIEWYWGENEGVEEYGEKHRSTSVGDIFVCEDGVYAVAMTGFKLLRKF